MPDDLEVIESRPADLALTRAEADLLMALGSELASSSTWWGNQAQPEDRTVIKVDLLHNGRYRLLFRDVVGLVRLGGRQIRVLPKIPPQHFLYLAGHSDIAPRMSAASANVSSGMDFIELLSRWFIEASEQLVRQGLRKEYQEESAELREVRGQIRAMETVTELVRGRAVAHCTFDSLTEDTPLNRLVLAACRRVSQLREVSDGLRTRARRVAYRFGDVGPLRIGDGRATIDRLSQNYLRVVPLARLLLDGCGISISSGGLIGTSFLIRTPEIIENGIRAILCGALPEFSVTKQRQMLGTSGLSMNPDLVLANGKYIGDIKYKFFTNNWNTPDLNQIVAFATAFGARHGGVFGFLAAGGANQPKAVPVGAVQIRSFAWIASSEMTPADSAGRLCAEVRSWAEKAGSYSVSANQS